MGSNLSLTTRAKANGIATIDTALDGVGKVWSKTGGSVAKTFRSNRRAATHRIADKAERRAQAKAETRAGKEAIISAETTENIPVPF